MYQLLSGVIATLASVVAILFLHAFVRTRDRFFAWFATSFALFAATSLALGIHNAPEVNQPFSYLPRFLVFALILIGIAEKNRSLRRKARNVTPVEEFRQRQRRRAVR